ncbi:LysR family transcriptional regulator [Achromobacter aloeverae]
MKNLASLAQVSVFVRIVELGSLSAAARDLELTPSAVSKSLAQLEQRLGVLLIKRTTRSLKLTDTGKVIFERANTLLADMENTLDAARQFQCPAGDLRITSSIAFGARQLSSLMAGYLGKYPDVNAQIGLDDRCINLAEEDYDVALRITAGTEWDYAARKLATIYWVYCAAPAHLERHGQVNRPTDLAKRDCLVYPAMTLSGNWVFKGTVVEHVKVKPRLVSNSSLALREAAIDGLGVACLPTYLVADDIAAGRLAIVASEYRCAITHQLYAMYFRSRYINPVVRSFIEYLAERLRGTTPWDAAIGPLLGAPLAH